MRTQVASSPFRRDSVSVEHVGRTLRERDGSKTAPAHRHYIWLHSVASDTDSVATISSKTPNSDVEFLDNLADMLEKGKSLSLGAAAALGGGMLVAFPPPRPHVASPATGAA